MDMPIVWEHQLNLCTLNVGYSYYESRTKFVHEWDLGNKLSFVYKKEDPPIPQ